MVNKWWRFTGIGGDRVITACTSSHHHGGSYYPIYIPFAYPTTLSETATSGTAYGYTSSCTVTHFTVSVALCPGNFYVYKPLSHPHPHMAYATYHSTCTISSCGPLAECTTGGGCRCISGYRLPTTTHTPTAQSYGCVDIDECAIDSAICGPNSDCSNTIGAYQCSCKAGYSAEDPNVKPGNAIQCIDVNECDDIDCGDGGICTNSPGNYVCGCRNGYQVVRGATPECQDIDECAASDICGPNSDCSNTIGAYNCSCKAGYNATDPNLPPGNANQCIDVNECDEVSCGDGGKCNNFPGGYDCKCFKGYHIVNAWCQDIDECFNSTICGPSSICNNTGGGYTCACQQGHRPTDPNVGISESNTCEDVDECVTHAAICGPDANCTNTVGAHICNCKPGFRVNDANQIASFANPCQDIDECSETPVTTLCGPNTVCQNHPGAFHCACTDGFFPSTGIQWIMGVSFCESLTDMLDDITPVEGQTKEKAFLDQMDKQLKDNPNVILPESTVKTIFSASMAMGLTGLSPLSRSQKVVKTKEEHGEMGSVILSISERLASALVDPTANSTNKTMESSSVDLNLQTIGPDSSDDNIPPLLVKGHMMEINLQALARDNNGSAAAAFMILNGIESLLSDHYFKSKNKTEMYSDVITATLPKTNHTQLPEPVNFTIQHKKRVPESGLVTCVYWDDRAEKKGVEEDGREEDDSNEMGWSVDGCWVTYSDENYTVCSCSHLSTFALILQIGEEPPPEDPFLEWLNRVCVTIGLFFFALAVFTFLLCSWNPKINNTARLHLCLSLGLSHLLLLWNDRYVEYELTCTVIAGVLHFLIVSSFMWMLLEALQLYLLVWRLSKVQVIHRDGLPRPYLYLIGYGVPFVIVGVSALVYSDGYGETSAGACWLSTNRNFNWALTGPVITVLVLNLILFCATLWSLRPTLANMKSDVSHTDTRLIVFKIVAQFVILGCTWLLGLYQSNIFFQVLFILLNSQQGTCLFIVHCLLNKEVREEYIKWLTPTKPTSQGSVRDVPSISEDLDNSEEQKGQRKDDG